MTRAEMMATVGPPRPARWRVRAVRTFYGPWRLRSGGAETAAELRRCELGTLAEAELRRRLAELTAAEAGGGQ